MSQLPQDELVLLRTELLDLRESRQVREASCTRPDRAGAFYGSPGHCELRAARESGASSDFDHQCIRSSP